MQRLDHFKKVFYFGLDNDKTVQTKIGIIERTKTL